MLQQADRRRATSSSGPRRNQIATPTWADRIFGKHRAAWRVVVEVASSSTNTWATSWTTRRSRSAAPVVDICIRDGDASWSGGLYEGVLAACFTLRDGIGRVAWARLRSLVQKV